LSNDSGTANVPEQDISSITKGQEVDVTFASYPGEVLKGRVLFVSDVLDPDTRRTKARIAFQNPDTRLRPNMFAKVSFLAAKQAIPVVATAALYHFHTGLNRNTASASVPQESGSP